MIISLLADSGHYSGHFVSIQVISHFHPKSQKPCQIRIIFIIFTKFLKSATFWRCSGTPGQHPQKQDMSRKYGTYGYTKYNRTTITLYQQSMHLRVCFSRKMLIQRQEAKKGYQNQKITWFRSNVFLFFHKWFQISWRRALGIIRILL